MEDAGWMNEEVRKDVGVLREDFGFDEAEARAYWHLGRARDLMADMRLAGFTRDREKESFSMASSIMFASESESRMLQHFDALYKELGARVLKRNYPNGWGYDPDEGEDQDG